MDVTDDNFYKVGTKSGVLSQLYSRNQIMPTTTDVPVGRRAFCVIRGVTTRSVALTNKFLLL